MSRDSSGNYTLPSGVNPVVEGTEIEPAWANTTLDDIAAAMTDSLSRSGKGGMLVPFKVPNGSAAAPGYTFNAEPSSGMYRAGTGDVRISVSGVDGLGVTAALLSTPGGFSAGGNVTITGTLGVTGATTLSSITVSGAAVFNGAVTLGDAGADTLTIAPAAVTWSNNPTHSGDHTFSGALQSNTAFKLNTTNCQIDLNSGNPRWLFDSGDAVGYDRTGNSFIVTVNSVAVFTADGVDGPQRTTDASTANGLVRKSQLEGALRAPARITVSGTDIDLSLGNYFKRTISGATTLTLSSVASAGLVNYFMLDLTNAGTNVTFWSGIKWPSGLAPTLTAAGRDLLGFISEDGGVTWLGFLISRDAK